MGRKNRKLPLLEQVRILDFAAEGKSVSKIDGKVIFSTGTVPGDLVDLQIVRKKNAYAEAKVVKFHEKSSKRITPVCNHFGICGGCKWQNLSYQDQLSYKEKQVTDHLTRIGKAELPPALPIIASEKTEFYRNKLEFTFSNKKWLTEEEIKSGIDFNRNGLGFHIPGSFDKVLDIEKCYLQEEPSNTIRDFVKEEVLISNLEFFDLKNQTGLLRNLIIRTSSTKEIMVIFCFFKNEVRSINSLLQSVNEKFPEITSLMYVINSKKNDTLSDQEILLFKGRNHIFEEMEGLKFKIGPKSFFQTNSTQAYNLYKVVREFAQISSSDSVYDLYSGTGTIAIFLANQAKHVVGLEYVPEAIDDAKENARLNNILNSSFYAGDIKDLLTDEFYQFNPKPDIVITDPPRAGMHPDVIAQLIKTKPKRIVYVSCNTATQARDLEMLKEHYDVKAMQSVDMFPHTHHVENVLLLASIA